MAKILVVDDEKNVLELVAVLLEREGHTVACAPNGRDGIEQVPTFKPDLIVMDVMMPVMDGYSAFNKLSSDEETRNIPVLILTGKGEMKEVFGLSGAHYMEKPFDPAKFLSKVKDILANPVSRA